jgi:uncharacterized protein
MRLLTAYGDGGFRFGDERIEGAVLVVGNALIKTPADWSAAKLRALEELDRLAARPELVLVGTPDDIPLLDTDFRKALDQRKIGLETMRTPSAARAFAFLHSQKRDFAAILIPE